MVEAACLESGRREFEAQSGLQIWKKQNVSSPLTEKIQYLIVTNLRDREVACSAPDSQGSNFEFCVWRAVSSHSSHHPQKVLLVQFILYVLKGGLEPDSFHFYIEPVSTWKQKKDRNHVFISSHLIPLY